MGPHEIKSGTSTEAAFHPTLLKMSRGDVKLYFAGETTAVQALRFKQTYLCGMPHLAHQLINFLLF